MYLGCLARTGDSLSTHDNVIRTNDYLIHWYIFIRPHRSKNWCPLLSTYGDFTKISNYLDVFKIRIRHHWLSDSAQKRSTMTGKWPFNRYEMNEHLRRWFFNGDYFGVSHWKPTAEFGSHILSILPAFIPISYDRQKINSYRSLGYKHQNNYDNIRIIEFMGREGCVSEKSQLG